MPSPGDCVRPLGEVPGPSGASDRAADCSDPTGRTTACTEPLKSAHQECEWKRGISTLPPNQQRHAPPDQSEDGMTGSDQKVGRQGGRLDKYGLLMEVWPSHGSGRACACR